MTIEIQFPTNCSDLAFVARVNGYVSRADNPINGYVEVNVDYATLVDGQWRELGRQFATGGYGTYNAWEVTRLVDTRGRLRLTAVADFQSLGVQEEARAEITIEPVPPAAQGDDMQPGEVLAPGQSISSANGRYTFVYQGDGNLVLYQNPSRPLWASNTGGTPGYCIMRGDGNLVIYGPDGQPVWTSNTGTPGSRLIVQDDGNVVIYQPDNAPVWETNVLVFAGSTIPDLDGWVRVTLNRNNTVRFQGHVHNGGALSFDFRVRVTVRSSAGVAIAMAYQEHVGGWQIGSSDPHDEDWDQTFTHPLVGINFHNLQRSSLEITTETTYDISVWLEDVGAFLVRTIVGNLLTRLLGGVVIVLGVEAVTLALGGGLDAGARIIGGTLWLAGPGGTLIALASEGGAALGSEEREISQVEYEWADRQVFSGTLPPREIIVLTDTVGGGARPFVFPRFDGKITLNLGPDMYADPMAVHVPPLDHDSTRAGLDNSLVWAPTQRIIQAQFLHELVHAWQLHNTYSYDTFIGAGIGARGPEDYNPGDGSVRFADLSIEQQGDVVRRWFIRGALAGDAYYHYIEESIRTGIA